MIPTLFRSASVALPLAVCLSAAACAETYIHHMRTDEGVYFWMIGMRKPYPAPTVFAFATTGESTLGSDAYNAPLLLLEQTGYLVVSLDLPCHGVDRGPDEIEGIDGWPARLRKKDPIVPDFLKKASHVLDDLTKSRFSDPRNVGVYGFSRGAFVALHLAATDRRFRCVGALSPVTDLFALTEFKPLEADETARSISLNAKVSLLATLPVWMCIGNDDDRVGTDAAFSLTRDIVRAARAANTLAPVELHIMPSAGHSTPPEASRWVATWIHQTLGPSGQ